MATRKTKPKLFIIESLKLDDEDKHRQEGEIISRTLNLSGKTDTIYYYIRTERELEKIIQEFGKSRYRYLHISCHADSNRMDTTFDPVSFERLGELLRPHLRNRRVFVSACQMACGKLAKELLVKTRCSSLIGPANKIDFDDAAAFWVSFYHLMFKTDFYKMKQADLKPIIKKLAKLYREPINYYSAASNRRRGFNKIRTS